MEPESLLPRSKSPQLVPIQSQIKPVNTTSSYILKIHFITTFPPPSTYISDIKSIKVK
jgi:hypothetical protein